MKKHEADVHETLASIVQATSESWSWMNERQAVLCILEAIKCGDFMREIQVIPNMEGFTYKPYREAKALKDRIKMIMKQLEDAIEKSSSRLCEDGYMVIVNAIRKLQEENK